jgi:hypothetical protein
VVRVIRREWAPAYPEEPRLREVEVPAVHPETSLSIELVLALSRFVVRDTAGPPLYSVPESAPDGSSGSVSVSVGGTGRDGVREGCSGSVGEVTGVGIGSGMYTGRSAVGSVGSGSASLVPSSAGVAF